MLIGITGTDGAGKGTVVEYLVIKKGFVHYSARALFVREIEKKGIENNRANMRLVANELRAQYGDDFLVTHYLQIFAQDHPAHAIIESIRTVAEAQTLKKHGGILLAVDANERLRYERIHARGSSSDSVSFEEFVAHEKLEMNDPDPHGMQKAKVLQMADHTILNNSSVELFQTEIEHFLETFDEI